MPCGVIVEDSGLLLWACVQCVTSIVRAASASHCLLAARRRYFLTVSHFFCSQNQASLQSHSRDVRRRHLSIPSECTVWHFVRFYVLSLLLILKWWVFSAWMVKTGLKLVRDKNDNMSIFSVGKDKRGYNLLCRWATMFRKNNNVYTTKSCRCLSFRASIRQWSIAKTEL